MVFFLLLSTIVYADWVDSNFNGIYKTRASCERQEKTNCFRTDADFDKETYEFVDGVYVKNPQLEENKKARKLAEKEAEEKENSEFRALKQKLKDDTITNAEIKKILKFILKSIREE